jgi:hypothetical protein
LPEHQAVVDPDEINGGQKQDADSTNQPPHCSFSR